jgi:hypothetical protein
VRLQLKKRFVAMGVVGASIVVGAGMAWATWSATGIGSGAGAAKVAQPLVVTAVTPTSASGESLYPGGPAGWVYATIQNPNPYAVTITGLSWGTPTSSNPTTCPNSNISLDTAAPTTDSLPIAAGATVSAIQFNGVLDLSHTAPDGCQGVAFNIPLTVTGTQQ